MIDVLALHDGTILTIRALERDDGGRLWALFARLSPESRYRRFLSSKPVPAPGELTKLTQIEHVRHEALAVVDEADGSFVAEARYVELNDEPGVAELAIEVADEFQNFGIGGALAGRLLQRARTAGIDRLVATTLRENTPARALMRRLGFQPVSSAGREIVMERSLEAGLGSDPAEATELELCSAQQRSKDPERQRDDVEDGSEYHQDHPEDCGDHVRVVPVA
jgi:RimJ/RimL family protein N-acetyltransferase